MDLILETERLILQSIKEEDATRIRDLANDKELADIIGLPHPYETKHAMEWISIQPKQMNEGDEYPLKIVSKELNEIIGTITLRVDKHHNKGELGYWLGKDYWGKGFATEAVKKIIEFGFNLSLNKICASAITRNIASKKVVKKAGLQKEGTLRQNKRLQNTYEDVDVYGLLQNEYKRCKA